MAGVAAAEALNEGVARHRFDIDNRAFFEAHVGR